MESQKRYLELFENRLKFEAFLLLQVTELVIILTDLEQPSSEAINLIRVKISNLTIYIDRDWSINLVQIWLEYPNIYRQFEVITTVVVNKAEANQVTSIFYQKLTKVERRTLYKAIDTFYDVQRNKLGIIEKIVAKIKSL